MQQNNGAGLSSFGACYFKKGDEGLTKVLSINDLYINLTVYSVEI